MNEIDKSKSFEEIYNDNQNSEDNKYTPKNINRFWMVLGLYFLTQFIISSIFYIILFQVPSFVGDFTEESKIVETIASDFNGVGFILKERYDENYLDEFGSHISLVSFTYNGNEYYLMHNPSNTTATNLFSERVDDTIIFEIIDGTYRVWEEKSAINIHTHESQNLSFTIASPYNNDFSRTRDLNQLGLAVLNTVTYLFLIVALCLLIRYDLYLDFKSTINSKMELIPAIAIGYLILLGTNLVTNFISSMLQLILRLEIVIATNQLAIERMINSGSVFLVILSAVVMGPLVEEIVFRKSLFGIISNEKVALVVSSIAFGLIHLLMDILSGGQILVILVGGISYFAMGFAFGYIYIRNKKNIWIPTIIHILNNLIAIIIVISSLS